MVGGSLVDGFKKTQIYRLSSALISLRLDIFVSHTNIARNLHPPGFEKKHCKTKNVFVFTSKIDEHRPLFLDQIYLCCSKKYQESLPYHRGKEIICMNQ